MDDLKIWNVDFQNEDWLQEDWFFKKEENARAKFDELAKKHDLKVRGNWWKNERGKNLWIGYISFED